MRCSIILFLAALLGGCGPSPEGCEYGDTCRDTDCADGGACRDVGGPTPDVPRTHRWVPYIDGAFTRVFRPAGSRYLNDHTLVRGPDRRWHLYGITHDSTGMPHAERSLLHATAMALEGPWREEPDVLMAMGDERVLWAPFVLPVESNRWAMYFWAGTPDERTQRADSTDLLRWTRDPRSVPGGRDPFVLRVGSIWYFYSVGVSTDSRGQILVTTSSNLETWSTPAVALEDPIPSFGWGNLESPTVVARDDGYYLFITRTSDAPVDYVRTVVFHSADPVHFNWSPVTEFLAHAAEVIEVDGQAYITAAGWTSSLGERWRGLSIAKLGWAQRPRL